jgi:hypothetical protein
MPKKLFKRFLPSPEKLYENRFVRRLAPWIGHHNLWHLNRRSVAGGVAVGAFTGLIPGPFQMISAAILSIWFRVNLPVAVMTTFYTNPFTIIPLYIVAYKIGEIATGHPSGPMPTFDFTLGQGGWLTLAGDFMRWVGSLGHDFFIGLFILACLLSFISYFAVRGLWRLYAILQWLKRKKRCSRAL